MDNNQPPIPGQNYSPDQPQQPPQQPQAPVQQVQQPVPAPDPQQYSQAPQPNMGYQTPVQQPQPPQQPQYQQQYPQQPGQMQQPIYPQAINQPKKLPVKLLLIIVGGVVALALIVLIALSLLGGSGLETARYTDDDISFSVLVPVEWDTDVISVSSLDLVRAMPVGAADTDETSLAVSRSDLRGQSAQAYEQLVEKRIENLKDSATQDLFGYSVGEVSVNSFGSSDAPAYRIDYSQTNSETGAVHNVTTFYIFEEGTGFEINVNGTYSDEYSGLGSTLESIVESYQVN